MRPSARALFSLLRIFVLAEVANAVVASNYAMYVWSQVFDASAPHCGGVYPPDKNGDNASCFYHPWNTAEARAHLWASCTLPGREVTRIFLSDVKSRVENSGKDATGQCDADLLTVLQEANSFGIEVYGLYGVSDAAFSEKDLVGDLSDFNTNCGTASAQFSGAAVNNEHFTSIKSCDGSYDQAQKDLLDNLAATRDNAAPLPLHFSVSWNWDCCSCSSTGYVRREIDWNGATKSALEHMIDIADSVDVQVAWNTGSTMQRRSEKPYTYWNNTKSGSTSTTQFYVLAYLNPNSDCRLSFAPHAKGALTNTDSCTTGERTEVGMYAAFDEILLSQTNSRGGLHYMGGVYSTGMPGWPIHSSGTSPTASPVSSAPVSSSPTVSPVPFDCNNIQSKGECNGYTDCQWSGNPSSGSCGAAPTGCGGSQSACTSNEDCCSGNCKGNGKCA
uniref:Uncharacterized protein n=1 Tax=Pseudictyota dubia TaxID=2749911 RepID=A0A7R9ZAJ6_9STRA|eukprot:CAMPEP_0197465528 /NCGR_PEP_ID=MMETSP1175-20131217/64587_1 /TAXON_ID=1003142 /ORGANISM="Triceratium dubium, Strain CCMP147" /LENGTH=444 /DNA_ID=CAMNT_0043001545 /DNA_START=991 /DNA_END=2325 /DNA_ORIENTATION=-